MTILPFAAAVLLATSCGKDDNDSNIVTEQPSTEQPATEQPATEQPADENVNYVKIPFSVKVDDGTSLSKVWYNYAKDADENVIWNKVKREFADYEYEDGGSDQLKLEVTGKESSSGVTTSYLYLTKGDGKFIFSGDITVEADKVAAFTTAPGVDLVGQFTQKFTAGTETPYSSQSLAELMMMVSHTYKAEFKSMGDEISLVDQNAYLAIQWTTNSTDKKLIFKSPKKVSVECNSDGRAWVKVAAGTQIECPALDIKESDNKIAQPGYIYTINRVAADAIQIKMGDYPVANGGTITMKVGETLNLSCDVTPTNTTERIYWLSHSSGITYSSNDRYCTITASQEGEKTIWAKNNNGNVEAEVNIVVLPEDCTRGLFSVSETKKVVFSTGLLVRHPAATNSWRFEEKQTSRSNIGTEITSSNDYRVWFKWDEWTGCKDKLGDDWFVLSKDEWEYLFTNTSRGKYRSRFVTINYSNPIKGYIIFPDNWSTDLEDNNLSVTQWEKLEEAGAVFLYGVGYYNDTPWNNANTLQYENNVYYWTSSSYSEGKGYYMSHNNYSGSLNTDYDESGTKYYPVRLVKEYK